MSHKHKKLLVLIGVIFVILISTLVANNYIHKKIFSQNHLQASKKQIVPWSYKKLGITKTWKFTKGKHVKIAILDSGIDLNHPDLKHANIIKTINFIEPNKPALDETGHGTFITGIIAAQNNNFGIVGIAPEAEIYILKILNKKLEGKVDSVICALDWCIKNKINIVNMSFSTSSDNSRLRKIIKQATKHGIIIVASARNSFGRKAGFPASYPEVISVASVNYKNQISQFSAQGKIDFCSYGENILSTSVNKTYKLSSGNSIAAAHLTGMIALILSKPEKWGLNPKYGINKDKIYNVLIKLSKDLGEKGKDNIFGYGLVRFK
ncbi:peptidase S8 and S53 subtilisin kexin sedolisin [Caldicellulosiruptor acetigenus I77R1B]|uniref:Peptidase S8 and S53 subtilisin kexin sedolisin n=1 Tax=Caldicellulosiruptor acetigenus (strain ATCC 700853 / DSM 12137 / I77R1B) TaxID=632335 RepID=E4S5K1_CALA7|nr:S8 family peptidase [Caldicellulosiruptor acetigenus]ADQ40525.1 peptidase S8 and S53 subtilisin kexin sedolisin [Caldicellulosiruptor acetigenus I77R1B]